MIWFNFVTPCKWPRFFFQDSARIVEKFGSHLLCLIRNEIKYKLLMIIFVSGQKKQMPTNFFKHLSRIQITKAADFSYCGFRVFRTITKSPIALFRSEPSQWNWCFHVWRTEMLFSRKGLLASRRQLLSITSARSM